MSQTQATVEEIIKNNKVVIFSQPDSRKVYYKNMQEKD
jgi:hypothetical protein